MSAPYVVLVLDCYDPAALAPFWEAALGYKVRGGAGEGRYVMLLPEDGPGPKLLLQRVPEEKAVKNRMHIDVHVDDLEEASRRLEGLGAARLDPEPMEEFGTRWIRMSDPQGNEFCICPA